MFKEIKIGGQPVALLSNAATPIYYKQLFGRDVIKCLAEAATERTLVVSMAPEIAYVMAAQSAKTDMTTLNMEKYIGWLEGFGAVDFVDATDDIWDVYYGTTKSSSEAKKK